MIILFPTNIFPPAPSNISLSFCYRKFMKEKKVTDEKIALQAGDFFKEIPKFQ